MEENIGVNLNELGSGFLDDSKTINNNRKINKLDFIQIKKNYVSKDIIKKMKRQPIGWENISANHTPDKNLGSTTYKI